MNEESPADLARNYARQSRLNRDEGGLPDLPEIECEECGWCGKEKPVHSRLPEPAHGEALCEGCYRRLRRETAGFPECPVCLHRFYLMALDSWGWRCLGCGLKFTRWMADTATEERAKGAA